jgi:tetratricopeptide (TPR) repeat protein
MNLKSAISFIVIVACQFSFKVAGQDTLLVNNEISMNRLNDSLKAVNLLQKAQDYLVSGKTDSALIYVDVSLDVALQNSFYLIEGANYELAGSVYEKSDDWEGMLLNYLRALSLYKRIIATENEQKINRILAGRYFDLGIYSKSAYYYEQEFSLYHDNEIDNLAATAEKAALSYYYLPNDTLAVTWFNAAIHYFEKIPDEAGEIRCLQKQALVFIRLGEFRMAEDIYNHLIEKYSKTRDLNNLASVYNNLGFLHFKENDFDSALEKFLSATENSLKAGPNDYFLTDVYSNTGVCYQNLGQQEEMLESFTKALRSARNSGRKDEEARISHLLSLVYFNKEDNYHAELYCQDCIEAAKSASAYPVLQECYLTYSQIEEKGNDFISALDYYEKYLNIRDSLSLENRLSDQSEIDRQAYYDDLEQRLRLDIADEEITGLEMKSLKAESERRENEMKLLLKQQELDR